MCIRDSKPRSSLRRRRGRAVSRSRRGPDPEERRTDGAAQPTPLLALVAQPAPLLALAEGREEAAVAGAPAGGSTRKRSGPRADSRDHAGGHGCQREGQNAYGYCRRQGRPRRQLPLAPRRVRGGELVEPQVRGGELVEPPHRSFFLPGPAPGATWTLPSPVGAEEMVWVWVTTSWQSGASTVAVVAAGEPPAIQAVARVDPSTKPSPIQPRLGSRFERRPTAVAPQGAQAAWSAGRPAAVVGAAGAGGGASTWPPATTTG